MYQLNIEEQTIEDAIRDLGQLFRVCIIADPSDQSNCDLSQDHIYHSDDTSDNICGDQSLQQRRDVVLADWLISDTIGLIRWVA